MTLSPPEHEHSAAIDVAVEWLAQEPRERISQPIVPMLRQRFGLSVAEACAACKAAQSMLEVRP